MALKTVYFCSQCGEQFSKWVGKCSACNTWNSLKEEVIDTKVKAKAVEAKPIKISKISLEDTFAKRLQTDISECDRTLGGGFVHDSLTLLSGDPGIGKSTLALQIGLSFAQKGLHVLYVSGEESIHQISARANRIFKSKIPETFSICCAENIESIIATIKTAKPNFVIADSVQTFRSEEMSGIPGSIVQTRHIAEQFMIMAKQEQIPSLLIGHVNKEGDLAGPKVLEHLVDTVLYLEGERYQDVRILRAMKNRFGSTTEIGVFSMTEQGFKEIHNPSEFFLQGRKKHGIGSVISVTMEGSRPFVIEVQGLTHPADYAYPKRTSSGVDINRLQLLIAVMNKYLKLHLEKVDVYLNIAGGFSVRDPSLDLAIIGAILSSRKEILIPKNIALLGEVGLSGEIRPISNEERRLKELEKLGFNGVWGNIKTRSSLNVQHIDDITACLQMLQ